MEIHGTLDLRGNDLIGVVFGLEQNFPTNPRPGQFIMKGKVLYVCVEIASDIPIWVPLTKPLNMFKHNQGSTALEWTITHNLNANYVIVQVFDDQGNVIIPDNINCGTLNTVTITFSLPTAGIAILQRGESDGSTPVLYAFEESFTNSATWVVIHNLGYNPVIRSFIGSNEVQPYSLVHDSVNQATITFSTPQTGSVRCI